MIALASVLLSWEFYFEQSSADCWNVFEEIHIIPHVLGSIEVILFMFDWGEH